MTAQQFNSEQGQKLTQLEYQVRAMLNRQGYYSKGVAKLYDRIRKHQELVEKLYPETK